MKRGNPMNVINIRNTKIGVGMPKICVPVTAITADDILQQTKKAVEQGPDLLEWRADFYENLFDIAMVKQTAEKMRDILGQIPLIFTIRTTSEGGNCKIAPDAYREILKKVAQIETIDLIDVEIFMDASMKGLIKDLQNAGKFIIASNHHFHRTPTTKEMEQILWEMEFAGADIRKLAVMPSCPEDVLALLSATALANKTGKRPVITMSMSGLGAISRVAGQIFGSCVTFGTVGTASAPGQLELSDLKCFLEKLQP